MAVTIQDIADHLNVSIATVSRSLRNDRNVNPKSRARVQAAAASLGYQGRVRRKSSKQRRRRGLGRIDAILAAETVETGRLISNYIRFMEGMDAEADAMDAWVKYHALGHQVRGKLTSDLLPEQITKGEPHAMILIGPESQEDVELLSQYAPIISLQCDYRPINCDVIQSEDGLAMQMIMDHLWSLGHRNIRWVGEVPGNHIQADQRRLTGLLHACLDHEIALQDMALDQRHQLYVKANTISPFITEHRQGITNPQVLEQWVRQDRVTAMVCASDRVANNVILHLTQLGIDVPGQVSVTGFDQEDTPDGMPKLTTIDPMYVEMGRTAMRLVEQRVQRLTAFPQRVQHVNQLIVGQTTALRCT